MTKFRFLAVVFLTFTICTLLLNHFPAHAQTCSNNPTSSDSITTTVNITQTGTYTVWSRLLTPDSTDDSYYLQMDGGCAINVGDSGTIPPNTWTWINYQDGNTASVTTMSLSSGTHTIKFTARESNVSIDRVLFVADSCVPTGTGDNCATSPTVTLSPSATPTAAPVSPTQVPSTIPTTLPTDIPTALPTAIPTPLPTATPTPRPTATPTFLPTPTPIPPDTTPPTVSITSPKNGASVKRGKNLSITASASDNVGVIKVQFLVSGSVICIDTTSPYSCNWQVPNKNGATYTLTAQAYDAAGNAASNSITVKSSN